MRQEVGEMKVLNEKSGNRFSHVPIVSGGLRSVPPKVGIGCFFDTEGI